MVLDTLLGWGNHISWVLLINGFLHLALVGVYKAKLEASHPLKRWGNLGTSVALFPIGVVQFVSFILYLFLLAVGERGPALLPPEYAGYAIPYTILQAAFMLVGSMSAIGQVGRKVPWAVLTGGGFAAIGGGSVWTVANGLNLSTFPVLLGSAAIAAVLFISMFFITLPGQEAVKTAGEFLAFSWVTLLTGTVMSILGILSGMGLVIL